MKMRHEPAITDTFVAELRKKKKKREERRDDVRRCSRDRSHSASCFMAAMPVSASPSLGSPTKVVFALDKI